MRLKIGVFPRKNPMDDARRVSERSLDCQPMSERPLVASFCTTFLKPEMQHIYRQVTGLRECDTYVLTKQRVNEAKFPFSDVEKLPRAGKNFIRRYYLKHIRKQPAIVYRGEFQTLFKVLRRRPADLMHIYFGHTAVHLLPAIEAWSRPCVVSFHGMDVMIRQKEPGYAERMRRMLEVVPLVMVRSESLRDRVVELGCDPAKIRLNRTGIPLESFPFHEREYPEDGAWRVVQACRLIPKKGIPTAMLAFAELLRCHPKARFILAGEGPMEEQLRGYAAELGIERSVEFCGFLDQSALNRLYRDAHLFMHPSQLTADQNQEGIPNSMLEAMSTGLPVLATRHGGIPEAVTHGIEGILVGEKDHVALAAELLALTGDRERWRAMSRAASASVHANFEHSAQIARLESYYKEVAGMSWTPPVAEPVLT